MSAKKIFLSYRRDDSPGYVSRLEDDLERAFGRGRVFRDVEDIKGGAKWKQVLERNLADAAAVLLVIGPRWEEIWEAHRNDPGINYVAFELGQAQERNIPVIPITVDGASLSPNIDLGEIAWIRENQTYDISDKQGRWSSDLDGLIRVLETIDGVGQARSAGRSAEPVKKASSGKLRWVVIAVLIAAALLFVFSTRTSTREPAVAARKADAGQPVSTTQSQPEPATSTGNSSEPQVSPTVTQSAAKRSPPATGTRLGQVTIEAPAKGIAAHSVEIRISGPAQANYWFGFAPAGSANTGRAANQFGVANTDGGEQVFKLAVPTTPGDYELRYRTRGGDAVILARRPFRSVAPQLRIQAPMTAPADGNVEVRLLGDVGRYMHVTVVPTGSPESATGNAAPGLEQGTEFTRVIPRLPNEPGDYEIRCIGNWTGGKQVYARRKLTIR